jgi:3-deoxy-manno-octulosonate cytidylyltransferase (CMP-KDO synthetase)
MHVFVIIPARYASTRLPGKPLVPIGEKPMIRHVCERAAGCALVEAVVVATDDQRIARAVESFGGRCVLTRADHPSGTDRIAEAADLLGLAEDDLVVNVQGDEPLLDPAMIAVLVRAAEETGCEMATLAFRSADRREYLDPNCVKVVTDERGRALYFSRSPIPFVREGNGPLTFLKHLGFYAYRRSFLRRFVALPPGKLESVEKLEQLRALENGHAVKVVLSPVDSLSVDTGEDLERVRAIVAGIR